MFIIMSGALIVENLQFHIRQNAKRTESWNSPACSHKVPPLLVILRGKFLEGDTWQELKAKAGEAPGFHPSWAPVPAPELSCTGSVMGKGVGCCLQEGSSDQFLIADGGSCH